MPSADLGPTGPDLGSDLGPAGTGGLPYTVTVVDPQHGLAPDTDAVLADLEAAVADWAPWIDSRGTVTIEIDVVATTETGRFSGGAGYQVFVEERNGHQVYENAAVHKMRTGEATSPTTPDVVIQIQPEYMRANYFIDPAPQSRTTPIPANKVDLVTVLAHELGHGLGLSGYVNPKTGALLQGTATSSFDEQFLDSPSLQAPRLNGAHVTATYGGPAPITYFTMDAPTFSIQHGGKTYVANESPTQNYYHYGRFDAVATESDLTFFGLMAGAWINPAASGGLRIRVNALDAAILADLGVPTRTP